MNRCFWDEGVPAPAGEPGPVPERVDVAVVGAGYTGLAAALRLGRHGARVAVLERHRIGWGASGRNGGFVLSGFQPGLAELAAKVGNDRAGELWRFSREAVAALEALLAAEAIACDYRRCGAAVLAARPAHLAELVGEQRCLAQLAGHETELLGPAEVGRVAGSRCYHGALVDAAGGSLHPGRYVAGLAAAALRAGARVYEGAEVTRLRTGPGGWELETGRGTVRAGEVLVASDGYTGVPFHGLRRRVVPVGSYLIATAPLDPALARRLVPDGRVLSDTRRLLHYFRLSPDGRMLFGGRTSMLPVGTERAAGVLQRAMHRIFPELGATPVHFAWSGRVGFTRDRLPHAGRLDGVHYALGYCGHGVALATWMGGRMGDVLAGRGTIPDLGPLPAVPLYRGTPWFLPLVDGYYRIRDLMD